MTLPERASPTWVAWFSAAKMNMTDTEVKPVGHFSTTTSHHDHRSYLTIRFYR